MPRKVKRVRKKNRTQINNQAQRILDEISRRGRQGTITDRQAEERIWRTLNAADRYERNILSRVQRTKAYQTSLRDLSNARMAGDVVAAREAYNRNAKASNKPYSRNTYMGLSTGG